jgi:rRNA maturation RNase YbeY
LAIRYFNEDIVVRIANKRILKKWIQSIIVQYRRVAGDINYIYTSNTNILAINQKYLNHNYYTDIITFNYNSENTISGDIYISLDTVRENSLKYNVSFANELHRVMVHGILHLTGLNDSNDKEKDEMRKAEDDALRILYTKFLPNS